MPAPKLATSLPVASNFWIGARLEPEQSSAVAQRSKTHTLLPSRSMSTPIAAPHLRPAGSLAQPTSSRYGLGAALGSAPPCAWGRSSDNMNDAMMATASAQLIARACHMMRFLLPGLFDRSFSADVLECYSSCGIAAVAENNSLTPSP